MKYLPKLHQLQVFHAVIMHGSIRAAAKAINQSQSGVTRSIQDLEKIVGMTLMIRRGGGIVLTEAGKLFEVRTQLILNELGRTINEIDSLKYTTSGSVSLGLSSLPIFTVFPLAIKKFKRKFPHSKVFNVEGQTTELLPHLRCGKLDFIVGTSISPEFLSGFIQEPLFNASYCIYARKGHPLADSTSLSELKDADWYLPSGSTVNYKELEMLLDNSNGIVMRGEGMSALHMVINADYLTIADKAIMHIPHFSQNLCIIPIKETLCTIQYGVVYSSERPLTLASRNLIDEIRWECGSYPWFSGSPIGTMGAKL
jgi:LysR family tdc operon transcriptional activator/LysR family transcriptional regulator of abg operon